jgi:hypothetical protein
LSGLLAFCGRAPQARLILETFHYGQVLSVTITLHNGIHRLPGVADAFGNFVNTDLSINPEEGLCPTDLTSISVRMYEASQCLTRTGC